MLTMKCKKCNCTYNEDFGTQLYTEFYLTNGSVPNLIPISPEARNMIEAIPAKISNIEDKKCLLPNTVKYEIIKNLIKQFKDIVPQFVVKDSFKEAYKDMQIIIPVPTLNNTSVLKTIDTMTTHFDTVLIMHPLITAPYDETSYIVTVKTKNEADTKYDYNIITNCKDIINFHHIVCSRYFMFAVHAKNDLYSNIVIEYLQQLKQI